MEDELRAVIIPLSSLTAEALEGVLENFVLREGTEYGNTDHSLESKLAQVRKQIENGHTKIIYDPTSESVTLMTETQWRKISGENYEGK